MRKKAVIAIAIEKQGMAEQKRHYLIQKYHFCTKNSFFGLKNVFVCHARFSMAKTAFFHTSLLLPL